MRKNVTLAKLGKPVYYPSVTFRSQTPGSVAPLAFHFLRSVRPLNPTHPSVRTPKHRFPLFNCPDFSIAAYPFQALEKPQHFNHGLSTLSACQDQAQDARRTQKEDGEPKPFPMSAQFLIKKNPSKKSTVRRALATSIKAAICLIIVRGAGVEKSASGGVKMVLNEEREYLRNPPVVPGWTYTFTIPTAVHPPPTTELVDQLRHGFASIQKEIIGLEAQWSGKGKSVHPTLQQKSNVHRRSQPLVDKSSERLFNDSKPVKMTPFSLSAKIGNLLRPSGQSADPRSDPSPTSRTRPSAKPYQSHTSTMRQHPEAPKVKPTGHVRHPSKPVDAPEPRTRLLELRQHAPSSIPSIRSKLFQHRTLPRQGGRRFEDEF